MFKLYDKNELVFEGNIEQVANLLNVSQSDIQSIKNTGETINGKYKVTEIVTKITSTDVENHLFKENGTRLYNRKPGYPNRYKDASCVRFTPL